MERGSALEIGFQGGDDVNQSLRKFRPMFSGDQEPVYNTVLRFINKLEKFHNFNHN